ncbi:MAG TPA: histidine kinase [Thermoleophilaceae bacterium]|nr:histidine kinase [Thermoleophilaceae bacterium]
MHGGGVGAEGRLRLKLAAAAAVGLGLSAGAAALAASGAPDSHAELAATARALMVAVPVAAGLYACYRRPDERFGPLLVAAGFGWSLTTLAESSNEVLYSVGRVAAWSVEIGLIYLILAFPSGRLTGRVDRVLVAAGAALVATMYLPTAFLADGFPVPSPYTSCDADCPQNAFLVPGSEPGFVDSLVVPLRELLSMLLFAAVTARLAQRVHQASGPMRRTLSPVLVVAIARLALLVVATAMRRVNPEAPLLDVLVWMIALAVPAMAAAFIVGLLRWRFFLSDALQGLALRLRSDLSSEDLTAALAKAFGDPSLRLAYPVGGDPGAWVDAGGRPVQLPSDGSGRCATEIRAHGRSVAVIIHDAALQDQGEFVPAAASYAQLALENQRLLATHESSSRELRESRARIAASADRQRRGIERDLHDGAQQRLVALRIKLELAEDLVREDPERGLVKLHALGGELTEALEEIRALAHGVYPSLLADRGLAEALRAAALHAPIPTEVVPDGVGRYPPELESVVYFCCLEGLQNVSKHAGGATRVTIALAADDELRFEVRDDGPGFNGDARSGAGLTNMRDRLAAVDGALTIRSTPHQGTVVSGSIPLR